MNTAMKTIKSLFFSITAVFIMNGCGKTADKTSAHPKDSKRGIVTSGLSESSLETLPLSFTTNNTVNGISFLMNWRKVDFMYTVTWGVGGKSFVCTNVFPSLQGGSFFASLMKCSNYQYCDIKGKVDGNGLLTASYRCGGNLIGKRYPYFPGTFSLTAQFPVNKCALKSINMLNAKAQGIGYVIPGFNEWGADNLTTPYRSTLKLYENGKPLGPAHSRHQSIRDLGLGRFSHWGLDHVAVNLYFSSSDNSDPRTNGRVYQYEKCQ